MHHPYQVQAHPYALFRTTPCPSPEAHSLQSVAAVAIPTPAAIPTTIAIAAAVAIATISPTAVPACQEHPSASAQHPGKLEYKDVRA